MTREDQLQHVNQILRAITRVNQAILHIRHEPRRLLREICDILVQERAYTTVWIGELRNDDLFPTAASAEVNRLQDEMQTWVVQSLYNQNAAKQAYQEAQTIIAQKEQRLSRTGHTRMWTTAAVPIRVNGEITAVLNACTDDADAFDAAEIQLLEELAANTGFAGWRRFFPSEAQAVATVDRLIDNATILRFSGKGFRKPKEVIGEAVD
jgi:GAF domain-containing protein